MVRRIPRGSGTDRPAVVPVAVIPSRRILRVAVAVALILAVVTGTVSSCTDDADAFSQALAGYGYPDTFRCADVTVFCEVDSGEGDLVRTFCCGTCQSDSNNNNKNNSNGPSSLSDADGFQLPPKDRPLELYLMGGQSECKGAAVSKDLYQDGSTKYPDLQGTIDGVWHARYVRNPSTVNSPETFYIGPMSAGTYKFGPEVSFGERIRAAKSGSNGGNGGNVMVVKYCEGATSAWDSWNPETQRNSWDRSRDDGTAAFLEPYIRLDGGTSEVKGRQFVVRTLSVV